MLALRSLLVGDGSGSYHDCNNWGAGTVAQVTSSRVELWPARKQVPGRDPPSADTASCMRWRVGSSQSSDLWMLCRAFIPIYRTQSSSSVLGKETRPLAGSFSRNRLYLHRHKGHAGTRNPTNVRECLRFRHIHWLSRRNTLQTNLIRWNSLADQVM